MSNEKGCFWEQVALAKDRAKEWPDWMDAPITASKWRNLYFNKDGSSSLGMKASETEQEALQVYQEFSRLLNQNPQSLAQRCDGSVYRWSQHSHCIQIPIKD